MILNNIALSHIALDWLLTFWKETSRLSSEYFPLEIGLAVSMLRKNP